MSLLTALADLFVPHSRNNHRAKLLHPACLTVVVAIFLIAQFGINFFALTSPAILGFASDIRVDQVIELTNQKRLEQGLTPLQISPRLNEVAQRKAKDMFSVGYWAHTSPTGRDPWSFFQEVGYDYLYAGENLARDFMDSGSMVTAWMNSPTHRDNIVNSHYQEIGLAVVNGSLDGVETTLVVQVFGTPTPAPLPESVGGRQSSLLNRLQLPQVSAATASERLSAASQQTNGALVSPFLLTKTLTVFLLGLVLGALVIDAWLVTRRRVVRLAGKNLAHLIFIGTILLMVWLTLPGAIL